jgi:hypothetical protein
MANQKPEFRRPVIVGECEHGQPQYLSSIGTDVFTFCLRGHAPVVVHREEEAEVADDV